jgi:hypothetical protein
MFQLKRIKGEGAAAAVGDADSAGLPSRSAGVPEVRGIMKIIGFIEARQWEVIRKIPEYCGLWKPPPDPRPARPRPGPTLGGVAVDTERAGLHSSDGGQNFTFLATHDLSGHDAGSTRYDDISGSYEGCARQARALNRSNFREPPGDLCVQGMEIVEF